MGRFGMTRWVVVTALVAAVATVMGPGVSAGAASVGASGAVADTTPYYLALGDSLAQGVQPNSTGRSVATDHGYADDLWARYHAGSPNLRLAKLGCPGETTGTMINGGICHYSRGSQLVQATAFLATHRVVLVTVDIGANNIDGCVSPAGLDPVCVAGGFSAVHHDLPLILQALRHAGPAVAMIGMTYYDPFVAAALKGGNFVALAVQSEQIGTNYNQVLAQAYRASGFAVADVALAFAPVNIAALPFLDLPIDLALICAYTWMCAPAPVGPNIHATDLGYRVIAQAFAARIG